MPPPSSSLLPSLCLRRHCWQAQTRSARMESPCYYPGGEMRLPSSAFPSGDERHHCCMAGPGCVTAVSDKKPSRIRMRIRVARLSHKGVDMLPTHQELLRLQLAPLLHFNSQLMTPPIRKFSPCPRALHPLSPATQSSAAIHTTCARSTPPTSDTNRRVDESRRTARSAPTPRAASRSASDLRVNQAFALQGDSAQ